MSAKRPEGLRPLGLSVCGLIPALIYILRQIASLAQAPSQTRVAVPGRMP